MGKFFDWISNLRPRQLLGLAAGAAILMFFIMYGAFSLLVKSAVIPVNTEEETKTEEENKEPEIKMKSVVVAARNIEPKTMLISRLLTTQEFPENTLPPDAVTDIAEVANKPARERIFKGDVITRNKVYRNAQQAGFVGTIPPDCRAVSISVSDVTGVSGFAKPGDYVDLILVEKDDTLVTSRLLMQNVLLLSINQNMGVRSTSEAEEDKESSVNPETRAIDNPTLATLALRPDEILELVSASKIGEICLMLRPMVPQSNYITGAEYTMQTLKGQRLSEEKQVQPSADTPAKIEENPAAPEKPVEVKPERIKIFYGDEIDLKDVNNEQNATVDANKEDSQK